jgi:hypothetical protein
MQNINENVKQEIKAFLVLNTDSYRKTARELQAVNVLIYIDLKDDRQDHSRGDPYVFDADAGDPDLWKFKDTKDPLRFLRAAITVYPDSDEDGIFNDIMADLHSTNNGTPKSTYMMDESNIAALMQFFIDGHEIESWIEDAQNRGGLSITFATNDEGDEWGVQTGDNSFEGGAYTLPHWGVSTFQYDTNAESVWKEVVGGMEEAMPADDESIAHTM